MATPTKPKPEGERSENLLPADDASDDGRLEVAEEVNLDQQSDAARHIGQAPESLPGQRPPK